MGSIGVPGLRRRRRTSRPLGLGRPSQEFPSHQNRSGHLATSRSSATKAPVRPKVLQLGAGRCHPTFRNHDADVCGFRRRRTFVGYARQGQRLGSDLRNRSFTLPGIEDTLARRSEQIPLRDARRSREYPFVTVRDLPLPPSRLLLMLHLSRRTSSVRYRRSIAFKSLRCLSLAERQCS